MREIPLLALCLGACAAPGPLPTNPPPAPRPVLAAAPASASEPSEPPPGAAPSLPEVRVPPNAACRLAGEQWSFDDLRLSVAGARFASVIEANAKVALPVVDPVNDASEAIAVFEGGAHIRLVVRAKDLPLYTKAPRTLLGILTPDGGAELGFEAGASDTARISFGADEVLASPSPVLDTLRCAELAIVAAEFSARDSVTKRKKLPQRWVAREGAPIAAVRGGPAAATLQQGTAVGILETRGSETRILAEGPRYVVSGWVASKDLNTVTMVGAGYGFGGKPAPYVAPMGQYPTCAHPLTLIGEVGSERAVIGMIPAGDAYRLLPDPSAEPPDPRRRADLTRLVPVELPQSVWLRLEKNARLLVRASELEACRVP